MSRVDRWIAISGTAIGFAIGLILVGCSSSPKLHSPMPPPLPLIASNINTKVGSSTSTSASPKTLIILPPLPQESQDMLLQLALTNDFTPIKLPFIPRGDIAVMDCLWDTKDNTPVYGISLTGFDKNSNSVVHVWVKEAYVPPMSEMVVAYLPSDVTTIQCLFFGPNLSGKWSCGNLRIIANRPSLNICRDGTNIVLSWFCPWGGWSLERQTTNGWVPSPSVVPNEGMGIFRLKRILN